MPELKYVLALDQGTSSSRAIVFDRNGRAFASAQQEFPPIYPSPGWVEHDPRTIWSTQIQSARNALAKGGVSPDEIAGIGITNQRETTVVWDRATGEPIHNAIVWQDRRTAKRCEQLIAEGHEKLIREKTGLVVDPYFSATKLEWILENVEGARSRAEQGELAFGTIDSWLIWNLTERALHVTDCTNASRTLLYDIQTGDWDEELLALFRVPRSMLPDVLPSTSVYGETSLLGSAVLLAGIGGDQQAALVGQDGTRPGVVKNTYGTGCFLLMYTGHELVRSDHRLLTTVALGTDAGLEYALEGSIFTGGAVVQWLRDGLGIIRSSSDVTALAQQTETNDGVYFVPAFTGLGAPHWDPHARGTIVGLTRGTGAAHIARAALESIAYQSVDVIRCMEADSGTGLLELRVDGGAAANDLLMQFQADVLGVPVIRPKIIETTALGAAYLAGLATGFWKSREEFASYWQLDRRFEPQRPASEVENLMNGWNEAVRRATSSAEG